MPVERGRRLNRAGSVSRALPEAASKLALVLRGPPAIGWCPEFPRTDWWHQGPEPRIAQSRSERGTENAERAVSGA